MGYTETQWKLAKAKYEAATKKSKPGAKFLGVFTKSSGLEPLFAKFDKLPSTDFANLRKLIDEMRVKAHAYLGVLDKAAVEDAGSNKDANAKKMLADANKILKADTEALFAHVEAAYMHDLEEFKVQAGKAQAAEVEDRKVKKNEGRGMVNFGPDTVVPQELVAAVKKAEAEMLTFARAPSVAAFNGSAYTAVSQLHSTLGKFGKPVEAELKSLTPFVKKINEPYSKAAYDNLIDQIGISIKRTKMKLRI